MHFERICYRCLREKETDSSVCPYCGYDNDKAPVADDLLLPGTPLSGRYFLGTVISRSPEFIRYAALDLHLGQKVVMQELYVPGDCFREDHIFVHPRSGREASFHGKLEKAAGQAKEAFPGGKQQGRDRYVMDSFMENGTLYLVYRPVEKENERYREKRRERKRKRFFGVLGSILLMAGIFLATIAGVLGISFHVKPELKKKAAVRIEQLRDGKGIDLTWMIKGSGS